MTKCAHQRQTQRTACSTLGTQTDSTMLGPRKSTHHTLQNPAPHRNAAPCFGIHEVRLGMVGVNLDVCGGAAALILTTRTNPCLQYLGAAVDPCEFLLRLAGGAKGTSRAWRLVWRGEVHMLGMHHAHASRLARHGMGATQTMDHTHKHTHTHTSTHPHCSTRLDACTTGAVHTHHGVAPPKHGRQPRRGRTWPGRWRACTSSRASSLRRARPGHLWVFHWLRNPRTHADLACRTPLSCRVNRPRAM